MKKLLAVFLALLLPALAACANKPESQTDGTDPAVPGQTAEPAEHTTKKPSKRNRRKADRRAEEVYKNHPELTPVDYDSPSLLPLSDDAGEEYIDRITFLCDSPTYWLKPYELLSGGFGTKQVWTGPEGTMTLAYLRDYKILDPFDNVQRTIGDTAALHTPDIMVIAVGINGIAFMDEDYFTEEYDHLIGVIEEASPGTQIILQSIYPISPNYRYWGNITNASITLGNRWILKLAEKHGLPYLDTFSALVGEDGNIDPDLVMRDGLHPNKEGLTRVLEYIRTHAYLP